MSSRPCGAASPCVPLVLNTLFGFASISTALYLPALPTVTEALHTDAVTRSRPG